MNSHLTSAAYDYQLPANQIAKEPSTPRDACKLLIYDTCKDTVTIDTFRNIPTYLPKNSFLVMNNTHVVPARLYCSSNTKKKIEVFILMNEMQQGDRMVRCMVDRTIRVGETITVLDGDKPTDFTFTVAAQDRQYFMLQPSFTIGDLTGVLDRFGTTPIPKYIRETPLSEFELREKYQTVFAKSKINTIGLDAKSVAAPTASLHFTSELLNRLQINNIDRVEVTLHVGLGTFAPITEENITAKKLFTEYYEVTDHAAKNITQYKKEGRPLIAVGTTAVRTLESYAISPNYSLLKPRGTISGTDIFIFPPFDFQLVDGLITNFHLPKSSLMMLVDALLTHKKAQRSIKELYQTALDNGFKFYSFGDAMMII